MIIFPAIDIQNGECVRLTKGDFDTAERVAEDPVKTALAFKEAGAEWLHMVDLDGAKNAQMMNRDVFITVARETEMKIELGGGIRDLKTAEYYLEHGIERLIVGSLAVRNPKLLAEMVREFGDRIAVGIDADKGQVKFDGWLGEGKVDFITLAREVMHIGVQHIIYTDISRDGTLTGPNLAELKKLRDNANVNVIASGGISSIEDIKALAGLKLYGAICGKALYRETLDLREALEIGAAAPVWELKPVLDPEEEERLEEERRKTSGRGKSSGGQRQPRSGEKPRQQSGGRPQGERQPAKSGGKPQGERQPARSGGRPQGKPTASSESSEAEKPGGQPRRRRRPRRRGGSGQGGNGQNPGGQRQSGAPNAKPEGKE